MLRKITTLLAILTLAGACTLHAQVTLPNVFSDNMVVQRDEPVKVWGWAGKGETVTVKFNGQERKARADRNGNWQVELSPMAAGGPYTMNVSGKNDNVAYDNILIGDVWFCSGQSNMEWWVAVSANPEEEIKNANYPEIRSIKVPKRVAVVEMKDLESQWEVCSPETVADFTAVGYYFARELHTELGVPIGIINCAWGGTDIEPWTSRDSFVSLPAEVRKDYDPQIVQAIKDGDTGHELHNSNRNANAGYSLLYNGMVSPFVPFRIKGAIWYQGENNAPAAYNYRTLFPNMIVDWRSKWGYEFPFYWVQLANFMAKDEEPSESAWAELREAQTMTLSVPNTGQAVIIDIGDAVDIHPKNKQDVGRRLARIALNQTYGLSDVVYSGPTYASMSTEGNTVRLSFDLHGSNWKLDNKYGYGEGFAVAGSDGKFHWAKAWLDGNDVLVSSDKVARPVAVRFGWGNNPDVNLYNSEGLPLVPFRTDD